MVNILEIQKEFAEIKVRKSTLISKLEECINNLPDNENIQRIAPNIYIMNFKYLRTENWSYTHYDFKWQYKCIVTFLTKRQKMDWFSALNKILLDGYITVTSTSHKMVWKEKYHIHPTVVENIKTLMKPLNS